MSKLRDFFIFQILLIVFCHMIVAMVWPERYGRWLQRIDNARYDLIDQGE